VGEDKHIGCAKDKEKGTICEVRVRTNRDPLPKRKEREIY
jgi:hypothetical protein